MCVFFYIYLFIYFVVVCVCVCVVFFALTLCYILLSFLSILYGVYTRDCSWYHRGICKQVNCIPKSSLQVNIIFGG